MEIYNEPAGAAEDAGASLEAAAAAGAADEAGAAPAAGAAFGPAPFGAENALHIRSQYIVFFFSHSGSTFGGAAGCS